MIIMADVDEIENRKSIEEINEDQGSFFEKISRIGKSVARLGNK